MDVTASVLQSNGFNRDIYVHPTHEEKASGKLWYLLAGVYGLVDSGKLWYRTSDYALTSKGNLSKSKYEPTLYFRKNHSKLCFLLVTQVDNYIYCGTDQEIKRFETSTSTISRNHTLHLRNLKSSYLLRYPTRRSRRSSSAYSTNTVVPQSPRIVPNIQLVAS